MRVGLAICWFSFVLAAGCTLRAVPVDAGAHDSGTTTQSDGAPHDASSAMDADGSSPPGAGATDAGTPPRECHGPAPSCTATTIVPSPELWLGYWSADHGVESEPRPTTSGGFERGVRRWRSLVGDASMVFPDDVAVLYPDGTTPAMSAALHQVAGWGADFTTEACASGECLPALRVRRAPSPAPSGQGDLLVTTDASIVDAARSGTTLTVAMQLQIAPDPASRTVTLFSFGDSAANFPYLRGYISGTTFRLQSQDVFGGTPYRVDFDGPIRRAADSVVIFVVDQSAAEQAVVYRSDDGAPLTRSGVTSATSVYFPQAEVDKLTIGSLGRRSITDAFDGRIRRIAISASALTMEQAAALADAWRDEDLALARSPAVQYANAIAPDAPVLFARLGESMPGGGMPYRAEVEEPSNVELGECETTFTVEAGVGGYVEIPDHDAYSIATSGEGMTVEAWVRVLDTNLVGLPSATGNDAFVDWLGKGDPPGELEWALRLHREDAAEHAGELSLRTWGEGGASSAADDFAPMCELDDARWVHVVAVADDPSVPGAAVHLFVNGMPGGSSTPYDAIAPHRGTAPLRIGARSPPPPSTAGGFLPGSVADVALYPRALTAAEVLEHYAAAEGLRY